MLVFGHGVNFHIRKVAFALSGKGEGGKRRGGVGPKGRDGVERAGGSRGSKGGVGWREWRER